MFSFRPTHRPIHRTSALGLTALTAVALTLGGATAAHAQTLYLTGNDNLTVNGTGTHGTYQGQPLDNTTTNYIGAAAVSLSGSSSFTLSDGGTLTDTGTGGAYALGTISSGTVSVTGGTLNANGSHDYGLLNVGTGLVTVSGGTFNVTNGYAVDNQGTAVLTVSGGTFNVTGGGIAVASLGGGNGGVDTNTSNITVTGGVFNVNVNGFTLGTNPGGSIDLFGSFTGSGIAGQVQTLTGGTGSFFGTLQNNSVAQTFTYNNIGGTITLHNTAAAVGAPEPASLVLGVTGGLPLLGLIARRRRHQQRQQRKAA